ncbi:MAG: methyltransferase domain-containing protein [Oligoflexia bacterium]|nr:methyltransferase domain-containing protein [Oligoflexia bacterium]
MNDTTLAQNDCQYYQPSLHGHKWPAKLFELSINSWENYTLQAAVKLDLFTFIEGRTTAEEIRDKLKASNTRGISMLLNALVAMELLTKEGQQYMATPTARKFFSKQSDNYLGNIILHHHELAKSWLNLDQSILSGTINRPHISSDGGNVDINETTRENFLMGMFNLAMLNAPKIVSSLDFSNKKTLLDLGGGPGTYAINFCKKYPILRATVFDFPTTKPYALKTIKKFNLDDRIDFVSGDFNHDNIPGKYDVCWLSHILHSEGPENAEAVIKKAAAALNPEGFLLIHEFVLDEGDASPLYPTLFSLNMLQGTPKGKAYNERELTNMLIKCGLKKIEIIEVEKTPSKIIKAERVV